MVRSADEAQTAGSKRISRRDAMLVISSVITAAVIPKTVRAEEKLPAGAAQFTRVLTAQRQWESLGTVLNSGRALEDKEWENIRGILRAIYQVSGDMEYLTKPWSKEDKQTASKDINAMRMTLKQMDEPAKQRQLEEFKAKYDQVQALLQHFLNTFSEASGADIPLEL
ncbi:PsbQ-like protein [Gracilaria domingensis]|nr:PsbQ-like protein [Gracilaria domingensis]